MSAQSRDRLARLVRFAEDHGFKAVRGIGGDHVVLHVPYVNIVTGETGTERQVARDICQLREILGY